MASTSVKGMLARARIWHPNPVSPWLSHRTSILSGFNFSQLFKANQPQSPIPWPKYLGLHLAIHSSTDNSWVSLAYWWHPSPKLCISWVRGHLKMLNNIGEKIVPCGTPRTKGYHGETLSPTTTPYPWSWRNAYKSVCLERELWRYGGIVCSSLQLNFFFKKKSSLNIRIDRKAGRGAGTNGAGDDSILLRD